MVRGREGVFLDQVILSMYTTKIGSLGSIPMATIIILLLCMQVVHAHETRLISRPFHVYNVGYEATNSRVF